MIVGRFTSPLLSAGIACLHPSRAAPDRLCELYHTRFAECLFPLARSTQATYHTNMLTSHHPRLVEP